MIKQSKGRISAWKLVFTLVLGVLFFITGFSSVAQTRVDVDQLENGDPRGEPELTICSQNLENYGVIAAVRERVKEATQEQLTEREAKLIARFEKARCDVIATQEVLGKDEEEGKSALEHLALLLQRRTGRSFDTRIGSAHDGSLHVGVLVAKDRAEILNTTSYGKVELPRLVTTEKPRFFARGPLEVQLDVKPKGESIRKTVTLVTFHFKARAGGAKDPTGLEWETYRMEEAEALRRILETRHDSAFKSGETILVTLGDRNGNYDVASAKILEGVLALKNFQGKGDCRLSKRGVPLCTRNTITPQRLFSPLLLDPVTKQLSGTFTKGNTYSWIDDILLPQESLRYAGRSFDSTVRYEGGVIYEPKDASDHAMVFTKLNW